MRQVFQAHVREVLLCYESFLSTKPATSEGKIILRVVTDASGLVTKSFVIEERSTLQDEGLARCVADQARNWKFPTLAAGETLDVTFPYVFAPTRR